jgi:hypothetical protein
MNKPLRLSRQRWLVAMLAMSLVLAQALWLLHRVAHVGIATQASAASTGIKADRWAKALLPDHQDERSCAQYDQLSHADMAPGCAAIDASQVHAVLAQVTHVASQMAAQAAGFLARGPPAIA